MSIKTTIIPVAGGKGGIGKSILSANLAIALARMGKSVVAIDLDLGGSNLYSYLNMPNTLPSVGDYLKNKNAELTEYLHPTWQENLRFLPGDGRTPFLANISYGQKIKLIKKLKTIQADYVIVDLGAGSSFNTLDYFALSPRGLLITTTEQPALLGMMVFLKNFIFRMIERGVKPSKRASTLLQDIISKPITSEKITVAELHQQMADVHPESAELIAKICKHFRPRLIMNAAHKPEYLTSKLNPVSNSINKMLSLEAEHFGFIFNDVKVSESIEAGVPLIDFDEDCISTRCINITAKRIANIWHKPIEDSDKKLLAHAESLLNI